jgi:hypothetical protein
MPRDEYVQETYRHSGFAESPRLMQITPAGVV